MKKLNLLLGLTVAVSIMTVGCSSNKTETQSTADASATKGATATTAATTSKEKKKLKLWFYFEGKDRFDKIKVLTDGFTKENPNIEVEPVYVPFADFKKRLSIGLAASDLPDIVIIDNPDHAAYTKLGLFADITSKLADWPDKDQYFEGPWKSATLDGKVYGIPLGSNDLALFYNKEMLDKAGVTPPQTWDDLKVTAKKLTGNGVTGLAISAPGNEEGTFQFMPWLLSTGATFDHIGGAEGAKALGFLSDMIKDGSMSKEVINWVQSDVEKQFAAGKVAMMINGPWQLPTLKAEAPDLKYGIAFVPKDKQFASVLGGENLGVVNGKNVDEAVKFIKYVSTPAVYKPFAISFGYFPSRKDVASDPYWSNNAELKVFADNLQNAQPRGPHAKWPEISNAISEALQKSLTGKSSSTDAAKEAQTKIDAILK